ncbi:nitroreductase family protein [Nanoarchaeota archaeon]
MDVEECIKTRRSVRKFLNVPVPWDMVGQIVKAGKSAPCAGNIQSWKFIVVTDPGLVKELSRAALQQLWMQDAPVIIVVCNETDKIKRHYGKRGVELYSIQDSAAAIQNMLLMVNKLGLGACWVGAFSDEQVERALGIPGNVRIDALIPIGYPDEKPPEPMEYEFKDLVYENGWRGNIKSFPLTQLSYGEVLHDHIDAVKEKSKNLLQKAAEGLNKLIKKK